MSERLQNKMYDYEVTPPANLWEKIAAELDESELIHEFPLKLYEIEITPPGAAWSKIKTSLNTEEVESPKRKKVFPIFRYAAAAAIIGLIAFGSMQLLKGKSSGKEIVLQDKKLNDKATIIPQPTHENNAATDEKNGNAALEDSKQTLAKLDMPARKRIKNISKNYFIQSALNTGESNSESNYTETAIASEETKNVAARYIAVMTPDCNVVRVSKKLDHLVCCVSGDDPGTVCKDQLERWREKIACSTIAASPGNFMDIVSLVNSLQEDND
ncbi:MAG TPA: hypothetical protein VKC90_15670 [Chitinophagaceae bacterium]|nr:hypothetical protein [Chitinophagaceae bacterium]